jgi:hypothetical protein
MQQQRNPVLYATSAASRRRWETLRYAGTYVSSPFTSRGRGNSYGPTSSASGNRRWSFRSFAMTRDATMRKISGEMGFWDFCESNTTICLMCQSYLVIGHVIVCAHALNLHGAQHPADVVDNLNVFSRCLLSFSGLTQSRTLRE